MIGVRRSLRRNLALVAAVVFLISAVTVAAVLRARDGAALDALAERNCLSIEALKSEIREEVREDYRDLERNARLLRIELTPEIRRRALEERNEELERFKPLPC